jgi:NitT/TauT family transport system permease protein
VRNPVIGQLLSVAAFLLLWEAAARWWIDPQFASPPSAVAANLPRLLGDPAVVTALAASFAELAIAFVLSVVIGCVLGLLVGFNTFTYRTAFPIVLLIYAIPQVTILPLFILYFGLGPPAKIAFGVSHGMFPIMLNVVAGIRGVNPMHILSARSMGASKVAVIRRVILPHLVPSLFAGMRLAMSVTLLGVMLAELYVSTSGIGYFTQLYSEKFDPTNLFSLIVVLAAMAVVLNESARRLEARFSRWH